MYVPKVRVSEEMEGGPPANTLSSPETSQFLHQHIK